MTTLIPSIVIPLKDLVSNLSGARTYAAAYFIPEIASLAPPQDLAAYIEGLQAHDLRDLEYSITLRLKLCKLAAKVPLAHQQAHWHVWAVSQEERACCSFTYDAVLLLPGEKGYVEHSPRCVPHRLLWPSRELPTPAAPVRSKVAAPSPLGSITPQSGGVNSFAEYMAAYSAREARSKAKPTSGANNLSPREPCKTVSISLLSLSVLSSVLELTFFQVSIPKKAPAPSSSKQKSVQSPSPEHYDDYLFDDKVPMAPRKRALFSPPFDHSDSNIDQPPPPKKLKPALSVSSIPRAYHALTAAPVAPAPPLPASPAKGKPPVVTLLSPIVDAPATSTRSKSCAPAKDKKANPVTPPVAEAQPVTSGSGHIKMPPHQDPMDHTMYARVFDPQINLRFHEPTSRHALECLQWLALPPAPASLLEPTTQGNCTAVFGVHSDVNTHLLHVPHLFWPCFNCSIGGHPELCEYEEGAEPGKEACLRCQANRRSRCSAHMDAHDFRRVATLLDPLVQSGDPAIYDGLRRAKRIEKDIDALYNVIVDCMLERNEVLHGLVDGLDTIAACEGGTAIIDQYAEASKLVRSLIIEVGKFSGGSEAE
ncbi:hypothetical protein EDD85DRAFT_792383 [Armillaria nabsnona]|nr:hypothetical protein EDD85DRAFT_792383 [Armillaria nabsnona]